MNQVITYQSLKLFSLNLRTPNLHPHKHPLFASKPPPLHTHHLIYLLHLAPSSLIHHQNTLPRVQDPYHCLRFLNSYSRLTSAQALYRRILLRSPHQPPHLRALHRLPQPRHPRMGLHQSRRVSRGTTLERADLWLVPWR
jgi:hypothetical protein